jgi:hypothetical protein
MADMGSTKGFDPMPPDQYLYFLGKKEPPLQRLLALVRSCTIQRGRRSAYCVDERGKEMRPADLERALQMEHGNFNRALREAVGRGLIRIGRAEAGNGRSAHNSRHLQRVYLCGSVEESKGYEEGEEKGGVCTDPLRFLSPSQRKVYAGWQKEQQQRFYAEFDSAVNYKLQVEREAIALARHIGDRALDQVFAAHALPKNRLATEPPTSQLLQLTLVAGATTQQNGSVQTRSVPTRAGESVPTAKRESVPSAASLLPSENTEGAFESVGQSLPKAAEGPTDRPAESLDYGAKIAALKTLLIDEYGRRFPGETPSSRLCASILAALEGAPLELLQIQIRQRMKSSTSMGFALKLAEDVAQRWREDAVAREKAEAGRTEREERERIAHALDWEDVAAKTLADPDVSAEDRQYAEEIIETARAAKAAGGGA